MASSSIEKEFGTEPSTNALTFEDVLNSLREDGIGYPHLLSRLDRPLNDEEHRALESAVASWAAEEAARLGAVVNAASDGSDWALVAPLLSPRLYMLPTQALDWVKHVSGSSPASSGIRYAIATEILNEEAAQIGAHDTSEKGPHGAASLERELASYLRRIADAVGPETEQIGRRMDAELASLVKGLGTVGKELAKNLEARERAGQEDEYERLERWLPDSPNVGPKNVRNLARTLWHDIVKPRLEHAWRKPPALVRPVYAAAIQFHSRVNCFDPTSRTLTFEGRELARMMPTMASFDLDVILRGLGLLGSIEAHRLFRWEVITAHDRKLTNEPYPNVLDVDGGYTALCLAIGLNPKRYVPNLRAIVKAQAHFEFLFPDGSRGTMLSYTERDARGRDGRARVTITLGPPLLPDYQSALKQSGHRKLVPLLRELPPLYGRENEHGQQLTMSLAVMAEFLEQGRELATNGSIPLPHARLTQIADKSGLPRRLIVPVVDFWGRGDTRSPPFLKRVGPDRYTLADAHAAELAFLVDGGQRSVNGARGGKKRAANHVGKLMRLGKLKR